MILILTDSKDETSTCVIEWIEYFGYKWIRLNEEDTLEVDFLKKDILIKSDSIMFKLSEIKSYWYRRGRLNIRFKPLDKKFSELNYIESKKIMEFIYFLLDSKLSLNSIFTSDNNKLIVNSLAREIGLKTPSDYLISTKKELLDSVMENKIITKSISGHGIFNIDDKILFNYTREINKADVMNYEEDNFFPSYFQNKIKKKYELRVFYLNQKFHSMAIFSQKNSETEVDFRNYSYEKPNRRVPFRLPKDLKIKLISLMNKLKLNSGSIDIIVTDDNEYVFLEVNPIGQFGMVSVPCNYNVEKKIAEFLISNH